MKYALIAVLAAGLSLTAAWADVSKATAEADALHDKGAYAEAVKLLTDSVPSASGGKELAELYWRASRDTLEVGDIAEKDGKSKDDILAVFTTGEGYADKAIAADPGNDLGYYWKSANIGRWGQVKGILNALSKAAPMRELLVKELSINPERADPYYVLGELYREVPGWPVSFGNVDAAVSLGRRAVDTREQQVSQGVEKQMDYNFANELAKTLYARNWSAASRIAEQKKKLPKLGAAVSPLENGSLYEATVTLSGQSDREEAKSLVQRVVSELEKLPSLTAPQKKDLESAKTLLKGW
jgi:hypothetical protein